MPAEPPKAGARRRSTSLLPVKLEELEEILEDRLDDPLQVLEQILHALTKNQDASGLFSALHAAAVRYDKVSELAFAYEHVSNDKRIKLMVPEQQAQVYLQAARFFADTFGDPDGAIAYAERALGAVPGHPEAFARLESLLTEAEQPLRLAQFYVDATATESDRNQQLLFLSRAAELVEGEPDSDALAVEIYRQTLRIEPDANATRAALEQRLLAAGRHREAAEILEEALTRSPPPEDAEARPIRERLIARYMNELGEPHKAMPHVEALLAADPNHELARSAAEALLEVRAVTPRAIAVLADAYERLGQLELAAAMLSQELKTVRGPRRVDVQRRLAILKQDVLNDPAGALDLMAPVVAGDPGDDALRRRFVKLSTALDQPLEAARLLQRALQASRDPAVRARVGAEIGSIFMDAGDPKSAEAVFRQVLENGHDDGAVLHAAERLLDLYAEASDIKALAGALELVVKLEPERERRQAAARRLARLCESELDDPARAIIAYRALIGSPWTDEALRKLEALYEAQGAHEGLADILELRAERMRDATEARVLAVRAAELRTTHTRDRERALAAWRGLLGKYGPARDVHARLIPLLEAQQDWQGLALVLARETELAPREERATLLARLAQVRSARLNDAAGALVALRQALAIDPLDKPSRTAVEKLLGHGALRLDAADILEPLYRSEGFTKGLIRVLETRAELGVDARVRSAALTEAVELAERDASDPAKALELSARGLKQSVEFEPALIAAWIERVQLHAGRLGDPALRARALADALGDHAIDGPEMLALCRATAESLVSAADIGHAVNVFRRGLSYAPASQELLARMDELLAEQGSPEERLVLYRAALEREGDPNRRRELYHSIASLQRRELGDPSLALQTWRAAVADDPNDLLAHQALIEACEELGDRQGVYSELLWLYEQVEGERKIVTLLRMAEVAVEIGDARAALGHYQALLESADLADDVLDHIEQLARGQDDAYTVRAVLERRLAGATEPEERARLLERLGNVRAWQINDNAGALEAWLASARLSEGVALDAARATRLYERVLAAEPEHREAAERLLELYAHASAWQDIPDVFEVLLRVPGTREPATIVLELEEAARENRAIGAFVRLVDATFAHGAEGARASALLLAKARLLASDARHQNDAAAVLRTLIEKGGTEAEHAAEVFESFLSDLPASPERVADRRWLFRWRAEHASDRVPLLIAWARAEELEFLNLPFAIALYERVLEADPNHLEALTELSRLKAGEGDAAGALAALRALRERGDPNQCANIDLTMAALLLEQLGRPVESLDVLEPLLASSPSEPEALRIVHGALAFAETRARAAALLDRASESSEDPSARADVLRALLEISGEGGAEFSETRRRWYHQLLESASVDEGESLSIAVRAAQEFPGDAALWDAAERLARKLDQPGPVADAYEVAMNGALSHDDAETLGRRVVEFHEEWFEDADRVVRLLERVLELSPGASWAFDRLKLAFNAGGRWNELFALYDRALGQELEAEQRAELLREAAMAAKDFAGDAPRALGYLERLNELCPGDARIDAALERLYEREGHARPLIALLSKRLATASPTALRELSARIAALWLELAEAAPALELVEAMLREDTDDPTAVTLLERLLGLPSAVQVPVTNGAGASDHDGLRIRAARHLRGHYERTARLSDAARMMQIEVEAIVDPVERARGLLELSDLRATRLGDEAGAWEAMAGVVALEPAERSHRSRLAELSTRTSSERRFAELLVEIAEVQPAALAAELESEAAMVYQHALHEPDSAAALYARVLEGGADPALSLAAARQLDGLLLASGRALERCAVLERQAELESEPDERRRALAEAARVAEQELADSERAIRDFRALLARDGRDAAALDGLVGVLERAQRWDGLADALLERAALASDPELARRDRVRVARLHARERADANAAILTWAAIRREHGSDDESLDELCALLDAEARWPELAEVLSEEAAQAPDGPRRADLFRRLGELYQHKTNDVLRALRAFVAAGAWDRAIEVAASGSPTPELGLHVCKSLLELAIEAWKDGENEAVSGSARAASFAIDELSERLLESGQHAETVELLLRGTALPFSRRRRRELLREAACLCSDRLDAPERAIALFRQLFAEDGTDDIALGSVTRLSLLLEEHGFDSELVSLWEEQARARRSAGDWPAAAALFARAAELAEQRLHDLERAREDHAEGAGLGGEACLEALARLYEGGQEWLRAAEVLEWLCAQSQRDTLGERALRLAEAYVAAGERGRARARLEYAAATAIDASAVRRRLAELYREAKLWQPLAELLAVEASRASDAKTRLALLREAAGIHAEQRDDSASAAALLEQAVDIDPDDPRLRLALSDALRLSGRYSDAREHLKAQIQRYGSRKPKDRALVHWALSRVALAAGDRAEALSELDVANKIDPAHPGILQALARLSFEEGQIERAERMYRALLLVHSTGAAADAPSRAEALLDLSEIAARKQDRARALEFIESAFEAALENEREAECLERSLRTRNRPELLVRALEERLRSDLDPREAARVLADLATLHGQTEAGITGAEGKLRERARSIHRELDKASTTDDVAWAALGRVYALVGDHDAEERVIERRVALLTASEDVAADATPFFRLAEIRLGSEARAAEAVPLLEQALVIDPDFNRAERLLGLALRQNPADARALTLLEKVVRNTARPRALLDVLILIVALPAGPHPEAMREAVELARGLGEPELVQTVLEAALANGDAPLAGADRAYALSELASLLERAGRLHEALDVRENAARLLDGEASRSALFEVARAARELGETERALRLYRALNEQDAADRRAWEPLFALYREVGDSEHLVALIASTVELVESASDRARLRLEQATLLLEREGQTEAAAEALAQILAENPEQIEAATLLSSIFERTGRTAELAELLRTQLTAAKDRGDVPGIVTLSLRLGAVLEQRAQANDALDVYRGVLDWDRENREALNALFRLSEASGDGFLIADAIEALLAVERGTAAEALAQRLLALRDEQDDDPGRERALVLGLTACPTSATLRDVLVARYIDAERWSDAARVLEQALELNPGDRALLTRLIEVHRSAHELEQALSVLERRMAQEATGPELFLERASLLKELGRDDEALADLESGYALGGDFGTELVEALERSIARAEPPADRELTLRLAQVLADRGDAAGARARLLELVKEAPREAEALRRLAELELQGGDYAAASSTYRRLLALEEGAGVVETALKLADACQRAERFEDARGGLERALKIDPAHPALRAHLRALYERIGAQRELCALLLEEARSETDVAARHARLLQAGELLLGPEGDATEASKVLEQAHALSPEDINGVVLLARAYSGAKRSEDALRILNDTVLSYRGRRVKQLSAVYREISAIQLMEGFLTDALAALGKAFEMDMRNGQLAMQLGQLALDIDEEEAAVRAFRSVTMMKPSEGDPTEGATSEAKADAHFQLARIAQKQGDVRKARVLLAKALSENPTHEGARAILHDLEIAERPA